MLTADYQNDLGAMARDAMTDFAAVLRLARIDIPSEHIEVQLLSKPHRAPTFLPAGKMAVYAFLADGVALKVGKVGPKSQARYTSQHYNVGSAMSTLAGSVTKKPTAIGLQIIDPLTLGRDIRERTDRINILLPSVYGDGPLSLLEAFLHCRWKPMFEGRV